MRIALFSMAFYSMNCAASNWQMMIDGQVIPVGQGVNEVDSEAQPYFWNPYVVKNDLYPQARVFGYHKDTEIYYHVSQLVHRFNMFKEFANLHVDLGVMGYMTNQFGGGDGSPRVNILPLVSIGIEDYAFKLGYSPEKQDLIVSNWFLQMSVTTIKFW